jgi:hypothetical protein
LSFITTYLKIYKYDKIFLDKYLNKGVIMSSDFKRLVRNLFDDVQVITEFFENPNKVLLNYDITRDERNALLSRSVADLNKLGLKTADAVGALSGAHSKTCPAML